MKRLFTYILGLLGFSFALTACDDWLETEIKNPADLINSAKDDAYYERLRAYKNSDHRWHSAIMVTGRAQELPMRIH